MCLCSGIQEDLVLIWMLMLVLILILIIDTEGKNINININVNININIRTLFWSLLSSNQSLRPDVICIIWRRSTIGKTFEDCFGDKNLHTAFFTTTTYYTHNPRESFDLETYRESTDAVSTEKSCNSEHHQPHTNIHVDTWHVSLNWPSSKLRRKSIQIIKLAICGKLSDIWRCKWAT